MKQDPVTTFLSKELSYAVVGVSRNPRKCSRIVYESLKKNGYHVVAVNPSLQSFDGTPVFGSLLDIPGHVTRAIIITPPAVTTAVVKEAVKAGVSHVWIQQGSHSPESLETCKNNGIECIAHRCIMMAIEPVKGIHKLHRSIAQLFGTFPRQR